jgi:hypothetical protein
VVSLAATISTYLLILRPLRFPISLFQLHIERHGRNAFEILRHNISEVPDFEVADCLNSTSHSTTEGQAVRSVRICRDVDIQAYNTTPVGYGAILLECADNQGEYRTRVAQRVGKLKLVGRNIDLQSSFGRIKLHACQLQSAPCHGLVVKASYRDETNLTSRIPLNDRRVESLLG